MTWDSIQIIGKSLSLSLYVRYNAKPVSLILKRQCFEAFLMAQNPFHYQGGRGLRSTIVNQFYY